MSFSPRFLGPYLVRVTTAGYLNTETIQLNVPFA